MATVPFLDYIAGSNLQQLVDAYAVKPGLPRPFDPAFYTPSDTKVMGTNVEWAVSTGNREAATVVHPDSPSREVSVPGGDKKQAVALGSRESFTINMRTMIDLQSGIPMMQELGRREISSQIKKFTDRFSNLETNAVHSVLTKGAIYINAAGVVLPSSSGATITVDMGIPTGNKLTAGGAAGTYNIGDWSSAATDIGGKLRGIRKANVGTSNYGLTTIHYGANIPGYLAKNTTLKEYFARNASYQSAVIERNEIPDGTLGFKWRPAYMAYSSASGTQTFWAGDDFLSISPDPADQSWYEYVECGLPAPVGVATESEVVAAMTDVSTILNNFPIRYGKHAYGVVKVDPIAYRLVMADYFLPIIKAPTTYYFGVAA